MKAKKKFVQIYRDQAIDQTSIEHKNQIGSYLHYSNGKIISTSK